HDVSGIRRAVNDTPQKSLWFLRWIPSSFKLRDSPRHILVYTLIGFLVDAVRVRLISPDIHHEIAGHVFNRTAYPGLPAFFLGEVDESFLFQVVQLLHQRQLFNVIVEQFINECRYRPMTSTRTWVVSVPWLARFTSPDLIRSKVCL